MKYLIKYISISVLGVGIFFLSCQTLELDKANDPNFLTPDQASVDFFLNSIQEDFVRQIEGTADYDPNDNFQSGGTTNGDGLSQFGSELTRLMWLGSKQYVDAYQPSDSDDEWINVYVGILADIRAMTPTAEENGLSKHLGITQFIEAYVMTSMVDFYGDVPYSEIILGSENFNPKLDDGATIYEACLTLLDNAIVNFQDSAAPNPSIEVFYNNNYTNWIKAANTLKMKLYMQRRLVDPTAFQSINTILASGNYIDNSAIDFQYNWPATSASQPDSRHPRYGLNYVATGAGDYMSNWLMQHMMETGDPRIRYYFYRQVNCTPGASCLPEGNEETLQCSLQSAPTHYVNGGFTFCWLENGYWGRDHGDDDGIPPDGLKRTTFGVYPAGGIFDDDRFAGVLSAAGGAGGGGAGITPILTAAWVDLMQAEMAMVNNDANTAKQFMSAALTKQITKVQSFAALDGLADLSFEPSAQDVSDFISDMESAFDGASTMVGKWNIFAEQYFVTVFGNGIESYNFYRRTGYPTTLQPNLDPNPGTFVRSLLYPSNVVNTNSKISQKTDQGQPVFWDTNSSAPASN